MGWEPDGKRALTSDSTLNQLSGATGWGGFKAAKLGGLTLDWPSATRSIDQDLMVDLRKMRARARNQAFNSPIASKFLSMVRSNVIGQHGMKLAFKVAQVRKSKKGNGLDDAANVELARAWRAWSKKGACTVCGRYSLRQLQRLVVENWARDGEQFLRKVYVPKSVNPFGFQLQLIDPDQVDDSYNQMDMPNGHQIRMGVEVDANSRPVAYHVFDGNPAEGYVNSAARVRVPADQIIHLFIAHRTGQTRGYPWFASSMNQLNMLDGYFQAELTKARVGASLVMSIETDPNAPAEEIQGDGLNPDGSKAIDIGAGKAIQMPTGQHLKNNTPTHDPEFSPFVASSNRQIASGMNVAYHKLCNDLAGINYSSGRLGELEERDFWMEMQAEFIDSMMEPVYDAWLAAGLMWGGIALALSDKPRFMGDALKWEPRRWSWVDPLKDVQASTLLVQNGFETNESILNSQGRDLEEVYAQRKREQDLADELGLKFGTDIRGQGTSEVNASTDDVEQDDGSSGEPKDGSEKPSKPAAKTKPAPAKAKVKARELERGMHPANAALWDLTEDEA
jgi:lambda family phage portal protein